MADATKKIDPSDIGESGPAFLLDHSDPTGTPRPDVWRQAVADFYQLDLDASVLWSQIGPSPLIVNGDQVYMGAGPDSGEVTDILIDPSGASDQIIYITTDDGGIWKTIDGGTTWRPLTDQMFSISMGAVAMDPGNPQILYGGSGNLFDGGSAFTKGAGIYRSGDGGLHGQSSTADTSHYLRQRRASAASSVPPPIACWSPPIRASIAPSTAAATSAPTLLTSTIANPWFPARSAACFWTPPRQRAPSTVEWLETPSTPTATRSPISACSNPPTPASLSPPICSATPPQPSFPIAPSSSRNHSSTAQPPTAVSSTSACRTTTTTATPTLRRSLVRSTALRRHLDTALRTASKRPQRPKHALLRPTTTLPSALIPSTPTCLRRLPTGLAFGRWRHHFSARSYHRLQGPLGQPRPRLQPFHTSPHRRLRQHPFLPPSSTPEPTAVSPPAPTADRPGTLSTAPSPPISFAASISAKAQPTRARGPQSVTPTAAARTLAPAAIVPRDIAGEWHAGHQRRRLAVAVDPPILRSSTVSTTSTSSRPRTRAQHGRLLTTTPPLSAPGSPTPSPAMLARLRSK